MKFFKAKEFIRLARLLEMLAMKSLLPANWLAIKRSTPGHPRELVTEERRTWMNEFLADVEKEGIELGLTTSVLTIPKMRRLLARPNCEFREVYPVAVELQGRLEDEAHAMTLLALSTEEADYFSNPRKGWDVVIDRFPDTVTDIEEARKCFALSRYAATVFHTLQVVEVGLIELGKFIKVNDPKSGWTAVASGLKTIVAKKYEDRTDFERQHFELLEQVQGTIEALKNAWRNKVSHAQGRLILMTKDFSPEVAEEILYASRSFMRRLATDLPAAPLRSDL